MGFSWKDDVLGNLPIIGTAVDAYNAHQANKANKKMAREQMAFQERMSSTEMVRRVNDLKAAGLNPMLAALNQQGASSAQGAKADIEPITRGTASTALAVAMQKQQLENMDAQTKLLHAQTNKTKEETGMLPATADRIGKESTKLDIEAQTLAKEFQRKTIELDISEQDLRNKRLTNAQLERMQPLLEKYQELLNEEKKLGMTQKQIDEKFSRMIGDEAKWLQLLHQLFGPNRGLQ